MTQTLPADPDDTTAPATIAAPRKMLDVVLRSNTGHALVVLFDQGLCSITTFTTGVLVARAAGKSAYGLFVLGFTLITVLQLVQRSLISLPFTVFSPHVEGPRRREYLGSSLVHQLALSFLAALGFALAALVMRAGGRADGLAVSMCALAAAAAALLFRDHVRFVLLSGLNIRGSLLMGLAANGAIMAGLAAAYLSGRLSVATACGIVAAGSAMPAMLAVMLMRGRWTVAAGRVLGDLKKDWRFGRWTLTSVTANAFAIRTIPWLVLLMHGTEAVAVLGAMLAVAGIGTPLITGMAGYLTPKLAEKLKRSDVRSTLAVGMTAARWTAAFALGYVVLAATVGNAVVAALYSAGYAGHALALSIMAAAVALEGVNIPLKAALRVTHRPDVEFYGSLFGLGAALLVSVSLIPAWGFTGGALAMLANKIVLITVNLAAVARPKARAPQAASPCVE